MAMGRERGAVEAELDRAAGDVAGSSGEGKAGGMLRGASQGPLEAAEVVNAGQDFMTHFYRVWKRLRIMGFGTPADASIPPTNAELADWAAFHVTQCKVGTGHVLAAALVLCCRWTLIALACFVACWHAGCRHSSQERSAGPAGRIYGRGGPGGSNHKLGACVGGLASAVCPHNRPTAW